MASLIKVDFEGSWHAQYEYLGDGVKIVSTNTPVNYSISVIFDVGNPSSWYEQPGQSYITEYGSPEMISIVSTYGPKNPFEESNPSQFTLLSRHDYAVLPQSPDPLQSYQFVNRDYVQVFTGSQTLNWTYGLELHSPNLTLPIDELKIAGSGDFSTLLDNAMSSGVEFYTSFWNYTFETGPSYQPPVTYTGGIGLSGNARIVRINSVPEPSTLILLLSGLSLIRFRNRVKARSR